MDYPTQHPQNIGHRPVSPTLAATFEAAQAQAQRAFAANAYHHPFQPHPNALPHACYPQQPLYIPPPMPPRKMKSEDDDDYMPDAHHTRRSRRVKQEPTYSNVQPASFAPPPYVKEEPSDPTHGCQLRTSFPVARIKRIMQADEDIGKVAQVTPTVVSRALELFMIKLISAAAHQARGPAGDAASSKGPKRVLAQHLKKAILADDKLDFLVDIVNKVPDAPTRGKKETASDSEDAKPKKKGKKRKDSGDEF